MHKIVKVTVLDLYKLKIHFTDGLEGIVDLSGLAGKGVFQSWKDQAHFAKVSIDPESHTLSWPGGIDLAPEVLYEEVITSHKAA